MLLRAKDVHQRLNRFALTAPVVSKETENDYKACAFKCVIGQPSRGAPVRM